MEKEIEITLKINKRNQHIKFKKVDLNGKGCISSCPISSICENLINPSNPGDKDEDFCHYCSYDLPMDLRVSKDEFKEYIPIEGVKPIIFKK